ncbi:MAG: WD40 repeat domain-containing protein [Planctomycetaceae bacterium]
MIVTASVLLVAVGLFGTIVNQKVRKPSAFEIPSATAVGLNVSPDGKLLCTTLYSGRQTSTERLTTLRVFDMKTQSIVATLNVEVEDHPGDELLACVWNSTGSTLGVGRTLGRGIELWDTNTWTKTRGLPVSPAVTIGGISFDRDDNLYAVIRDSVHEYSDDPRTDRAIFWRQPLKVSDPKEVVLFPEVYMPAKVKAFSVSGAPDGKELRVAISFEDSAPTQVFLITPTASDKWERQSELVLPSSERAWVRFSNDGGHLAILDSLKMVFRLYRIRDRTFDQIKHVQGETGVRIRDPVSRDHQVESVLQVIDFSRDERALACRFDDRVKVYRLSDGAEIFDLPEKTCSVALSPDARYLLTSRLDENKICAYELNIETAGEPEQH